MTQQRLIGLCVLGGVLLHYPLLEVANQAPPVGGVPPLFVYLFAVWGGLVAGAAALAGRGGGGDSQEGGGGPGGAAGQGGGVR